MTSQFAGLQPIGVVREWATILDCLVFDICLPQRALGSKKSTLKVCHPILGLTFPDFGPSLFDLESLSILDADFELQSSDLDQF